MTVINADYWKKQVLRYWKTLERLAYRKFRNQNIADEALLVLLEKLEEDDWKRVRAYSNKSSFESFLYKISSNLLEDFIRSKFGRVQMPNWVKQRGELWMEIFKELCLKRMGIADTVRVMTEFYRRERALVEEAITMILSKIINCGRSVGEIPDDPENMDRRSPIHPSFHHITPDKFAEACKRDEILTAVSKLLEKQEDIGLPVKLDSEERLFLRMIYEDGLNASAAGRRLGWNVNQASGKHRRLLERIREAIRNSGMEGE